MNRLCTIALSLALFISGCFVNINVLADETNIEYKNPATVDGVTTWDCVWFGHYPRTQNSDGSWNNDRIKWRVINADNNELFLITDESIDRKRFNETNAKINWSNCTLRSWLNAYDGSYNKANRDYTDTGFLKTAFTDEERANIKTESIDYDSDKTKTVDDKIYCLSRDEAIDLKYAFPKNSNLTSVIRRANCTAWCRKDGIIFHDTKVLCEDATLYGPNNTNPARRSVEPSNHQYASIWWLRTMMNNTSENTSANRVDFPGDANQNKKCSEDNACVRPALRISADSDEIEYAGTINTNNETSEGTYTVTIDNEIVAEVEKGREYTFPSQYLGYIDTEDNNKVYKPSGSMIVSKDVSFTSIQTVSVTAKNGASIRFNKQSPGIAFTGYVLINNGQPILSEGFTYGMIIAPYDYFVEQFNEELTLEKAALGNAYSVIFAKEKDWNNLSTGTMKGGIINLRQFNFTRDFIFRPYMTIHYVNGADRTFYAENSPETRNAAQVAAAMKQSTAYWNSLTDEQRDAANYYLQ